MTDARIYQKPKNAMQSGRAGTDQWILEYEPRDAQRPDPLMGWAGSSDTRRQLVLKFPTVDAAQHYATSKGLTTHVVPAPQKQLKIQAYADNFR
jgi:ETC complex I subunit conserved region